MGWPLPAPWPRGRRAFEGRAGGPSVNHTGSGFNPLLLTQVVENRGAADETRDLGLAARSVSLRPGCASAWVPSPGRRGPPVLLTPRPRCPHVPPPRELHPVGMRGTAVTRQGTGSLRQAPWPCVEDAAPRWHVGRVTQPSPTRFSPRGACRVASLSVRAEDR